MDNTIQGKDVLLSFLVSGSYVNYACATDIAINISATKKSTKTVGSGAWADYDYQSLAYTISLNGVLKFDTSSFTGWDTIDNQMNFVKVQFKATFTSGTNVRSVAGTLLIESSQLTVSPSAVVTDSYTFQGCGTLLKFDGAIPCNIVISILTMTQEAPSAPCSITADYTGSMAGAAKYTLIPPVGPTLTDVYPTLTSLTSSYFGFTLGVLAPGTYTITVTPICANDYAGTPKTLTFPVL